MTTDTKAVARYPKVDHCQLDVDGNYYCRHVEAMTSEGLHAKSDIAGQLGWRDREIDTLRSALAAKSAEVEGLAKDAERWRHVRKLLTVDDILNRQRELEAWNNLVSEDECVRADKAIDIAMEKSNEHQDQ